MTLPETLPLSVPTEGLEDLLKDLKHSSLTMPQQAILFALAKQVEEAKAALSETETGEAP